MKDSGSNPPSSILPVTQSRWHFQVTFTRNRTGDLFNKYFLSVVSGLGGGVVSGLGLVFGVDGGTFVFDISDITVVVVSGVGHGLDTAVGKSNLVRAGHGLAVSGLLGVEVGTGIFIGNTVLESIGLRGLVVVGGGWLVGGGGSVGGGSSGDGGHSGDDDSKDGKTKHVE